MATRTVFCAACQKDTGHEAVEGQEIILVCTGVRPRTGQEVLAEIPADVKAAGLEAEYAAKFGLANPDRPCLRTLKFSRDIDLDAALAIHKQHNCLVPPVPVNEG